MKLWNKRRAALGPVVTKPARRPTGPPPQGAPPRPSSSADHARWAELLLQRDEVNGRRALEAMVAWFDEHDGKADDFGRLWVVIDAERALGRDR